MDYICSTKKYFLALFHMGNLLKLQIFKVEIYIYNIDINLELLCYIRSRSIHSDFMAVKSRKNILDHSSEKKAISKADNRG